MNTMTTGRTLAELRTEVGTAERLHAALARIDEEGWNGPTGRTVLEYARLKVVGSAVRGMGFTGLEADFAEASGWAAAWESLRSRGIRGAESPWGFVTRGVRHAVANEKISETYGTEARSAWRVHRFRDPDAPRTRGDWTTVADPAALRRPLSLTTLLDAGFEPSEPSASPEAPMLRLQPIVALLVRHGWKTDTARAALLHIAEHARENPHGAPKAHGWREMALELGIPLWQARRVTVLLLGTADWSGLVERLARGGEAALTGPAVDAAVRATCDPAMRPPARVALAIDARTTRPTALAS